MNRIAIKALAEYVIFNRADVAVVSPDRYEQRMMALAFCVQADNLLPECGRYSSGTRCLELENGSRVFFGYEPHHFRGLNLHAAVFEGAVAQGVREMVALRVRVPTGLGVMVLDVQALR